MWYCWQPLRFDPPPSVWNLADPRQSCDWSLPMSPGLSLSLVWFWFLANMTWPRKDFLFTSQVKLNCHGSGKGLWWVFIQYRDISAQFGVCRPAVRRDVCSRVNVIQFHLKSKKSKSFMQVYLSIDVCICVKSIWPHHKEYSWFFKGHSKGNIDLFFSHQHCGWNIFTHLTQSTVKSWSECGHGIAESWRDLQTWKYTTYRYTTGKYKI